MDSRAWWVSVPAGLKESDTTEQLITKYTEHKIHRLNHAYVLSLSTVW